MVGATRCYSRVAFFLAGLHLALESPQISPGWPQPVTQTIASLPRGKKAVEIEIAGLSGPTPIAVRAESAGVNREFGPFTMDPPHKWTLNLTQHTGFIMKSGPRQVENVPDPRSMLVK